MRGSHPLAYDVGEISGDVEEAACAESVIVDHGDVADRRADAGSQDAQSGKTLLFQPAEAPASVLDGLAVGLECQADVGADELIGALVALGHSSVVVRQAQAKDGDADSLEPFAQAALAAPLG